MSRVFVDVGMSLDGFIAGENRGPKHPLGDAGAAIHGWMFAQKIFRQSLKIGQDGETGADNRMLEKVLGRVGANIMGKRMFEEGEASWPEEAPFHTPVFVLTHAERAAWERPGGTTFHFVHDGIDSALEKALAVAGTKDVRISGGADVILQYLNAGLVDELWIHTTPIFLGRGMRLFDGVDTKSVTLTPVDATFSSNVMHQQYRVTRQ